MDIKPRFVVAHLLVFIGILLSFPVLAAQNNGLGKYREKFWVGETGPSGPIFSGPHQHPFICTTIDSGLGQPLVDNQEGIGNAVFPEINGVPVFSADPIGYSKNCSIATRVDYLYYSTTADNFLPLEDPTNVPGDAEHLSINGETVNFVVRLERGTINRFIYSIAILAPFAESLDKPQHLDNSAWNRKLVYSFQGGVGIGHFQGYFDMGKRYALHYEALKRGYAVAYSTGNRTGTHYNLTLMEETALMVKGRFEAVYGHPKYTIGVGDSGGAIQQYVLGQNNRHIIDAALPQLSYPDMITQTIHLSDCELMERYFDTEYTLDNSSRWGDWLQRSVIEGMVANNVAVVDPWILSPYAPKPGSSECINGWRELIQGIMNPTFTAPQYYEALELYRYPPEVITNIKWTHWDDLGNIYPKDDNGYAYNTVDNVGVQYGLHALVSGEINKQEFLDLNSCIGGWKQPPEMVLAGYPWNPNAPVSTFDPWNQINMNLNLLCKLGVPAPRTEGNLAAMNAAYNAKHIFTGDINIPIIDMRWYLEPTLNMHHSQGSFAVRARMQKEQGQAKNQVIWFAECNYLNPATLQEDCEYDPTGKALDAIDEWMANIKSDDDYDYDQNGDEKVKGKVVKNKPTAAVDACFYSDGSLMYAGDDAWNGILNDKPKGQCSSAFPIYSTSRIVAGEPIDGDIFKCALKPVDDALADGTYGDISFNAIESNFLHAIFPTGVCDYSKPDLGKPFVKHGK
jgi:hypothetical protein